MTSYTVKNFYATTKSLIIVEVMMKEMVHNDYSLCCLKTLLAGV